MSEAAVFVKTEDDQVLEMTQGVANMCMTLKNMLEDFSEQEITKDEPIPLSNIKEAPMKFIVSWCAIHQDDDLEDPRFKEYQTSVDLFPEDEPLFKELDCPAILAVIKASNFLDVAALLDTSCKALAIRLNGKTLQENATQFGIEREITMDDKVRAIEKHPWILGGCNLIPAHIAMKEAYYAKHPDQKPAEE